MYNGGRGLRDSTVTRRTFVAGNFSREDGLERFFVAATKELGVSVTPIDLAEPTRLDRRFPLLALTTSFYRALRLRHALNVREPIGNGVLILVKAHSIFAKGSTTQLIASAWAGPKVLLAPDSLESYAHPHAVREWLRSGGLIATFDVARAGIPTAFSDSVIEFRFAYDPATHWRTLDDLNGTRKAAVFVGAWDRKREAVLDHLASRVPVVAYGQHWQRSRSRAVVVRSNKAVHGKAHADLVATHRVALNVLREQNEHSANMRTFEIRAMGGLAAEFPRKRPDEVVHGVVDDDLERWVTRVEEVFYRPHSERLELQEACQAEVRGLTYAHRVQRLFWDV